MRRVAQSLLAESLEKGRGVAPDNTEAFKWLELACKTEDETLRNELRKRQESLARKMMGSQIQEAKKRAREWVPTPAN
jgi:TPR repeat protein